VVSVELVSLQFSSSICAPLESFFSRAVCEIAVGIRSSKSQVNVSLFHEVCGSLDGGSMSCVLVLVVV
jgi:hypothetical protein